MSLNRISTSNFNVQKLSLVNFQNKMTRDGINYYQNIPILYDGKNVRIRLSGRFKLKELKQSSNQRTGDFSLVVQVDDDNRKLFEEFEKKLRTLINDKSFSRVWTEGLSGLKEVMKFI